MSRHPAMAGRALLVLLTAMVLLGTGPSRSDAASLTDLERRLVELANHERTIRGLPPLAVADDLTSIARTWSQHMAATGRPGHNPAVTEQMCCWIKLGENVGWMSAGADGSQGKQAVESIHRMLMDSASHRANLLGTAFDQVGVGVKLSPDGMLWVTQDFRHCDGSARCSSGSAPRPAPNPPPAERVADPPKPQATTPEVEPVTERPSERTLVGTSEPATGRPAFIHVARLRRALDPMAWSGDSPVDADGDADAWRDVALPPHAEAAMAGVLGLMLGVLLLRALPGHP